MHEVLIRNISLQIKQIKLQPLIEINSFSSGQELNIKFNTSCTGNHCFTWNFSRKLNQELIYSQKPHTSIFLDGSYQTLKRTIEKQLLFNDCTILLVPRRKAHLLFCTNELGIRIKEFSHLNKYCFPVVQFEISCQNMVYLPFINNLKSTDSD